jgi:peptidoglycan/LPS O-acetylase OafA/YrhL
VGDRIGYSLIYNRLSLAASKGLYGHEGIKMTDLNSSNNSSLTSLETTNTLKGVAILTVLINHYLNFNVSGDYLGFANLWVSMFFIVSGYGIYLSLERKFTQGFTFRGLLIFYCHRFVRIFPFLWLALLLWNFLGVFKVSIWMILGVHGEGIFWFIPALLQCYLISIFIFYKLTKNPKIFTIILTIIVFLFNIFAVYKQIPEYITEFLTFTNSSYRGVFLLNILLFSFGMQLSHYFSSKPTGLPKSKTSKQGAFFFLLILIIFICIAFAKYFLLPPLQFYFQIVPLLLIGLLCFYSLRSHVKNSLLAYLGSISYPLYLFHGVFYLFIARLDQFQKNSITGLSWTIILFPILIFLCIKVEEITSFLGKKLVSKINYLGGE